MSTDSFMYQHTWFDLSTSKTEKRIGGTSLVAQWLRPCTPNAGCPVPSLVRELDPRGHMKEFTCHNSDPLQSNQ